MGEGNPLNNAGIVSPGGNTIFQTTELTGNFVQTGSGILDMQVDLQEEKNDQLIIKGGSASLDGTMSIALKTKEDSYQQSASYTLLDATDGTGIDGTWLTPGLPEAKPLLELCGQSDIRYRQTGRYRTQHHHGSHQSC